MDAEPLVAACELAFAVAREGEKAVPPIEPPPAMRNYLYVPQLPRRAMTVAERAIDEDPDFRSRVAAAASEQNVGREGYLWLTRPTGWDSDNPQISGSSRDSAPQPTSPVESAPSPTIPQVPPAPGATSATPPVPQVPPTPAMPTTSPTPPIPTARPAAASPPPVPAPPMPKRSTTPPPRPRTVNAPPLPSSVTPQTPTPAKVESTNSIQDELADLRGLVGQLSDERANISAAAANDVDIPDFASPDLPAPNDSKPEASVPAVPTPSASAPAAGVVPPAGIAAAVPATDSGPDLAAAKLRISTLETQLAAANKNVTQAAADAATSASAELEASQALAALKTSDAEKQSIYEKDLADANLLAEQARTEVASTVSERDTAQEALSLLTVERDDALAQVTSLTGERDAALSDVTSLTGERDSFAGERDAALSDVTSLTGERDSFAGERDAALADVVSITGERDNSATELQGLRHDYSVAAGALVERDHLQETLATIQGERDDLASRVEVAEQARIDLEHQLSQVSAQWQSLQVELETARSSLVDTRGVFQSSMQAMDDELVKTETILSGSAPVTPDFGAVDLDAVVTPDAPDLDVPIPDALSAPILDTVEAPAVAETLDASVIQVPLADSPFAPAVTQRIEVPDVVVPEVALPEVALPDVPGVPDLAIPEVAIPEVAIPEVELPDVPGMPDLAIPPTPEVPDLALPDVPGFAGVALPSVDASPENIESSDLTSMLDSYGLGADGEDILAPAEASIPAPVESPVEPAPAGLARGLSPESTRTQISFPADIGHDPLAQIRYVVATDDVVVLVDGDAVAEMGWPETPVSARREALVKYLGDLAADTGAAQDTVFSGSLSDSDDLPVSRAVRVRITAPGVRPADALAELVDSYPQEWPVAVVSDDAELMVYADTHGATVLSNGQLLDLLFDRWEASQAD